MTRHTIRSRILAAATVALVVAVAGACGGSSSGGSSSGSGGILRIGTTNSVDSLNPFVAVNPQAVNAFSMEYPQLVQYSRDLKLEGDWAKSWSHSADGLTWTFHLIPNTTWSDGTPHDRRRRGLERRDGAEVRRRSHRPARGGIGRRQERGPPPTPRPW